jgi:aspartyl-tRNA(Asn)/glutamyl-tRNA(Gln) amidotransferase subunit A
MGLDRAPALLDLGAVELRDRLAAGALRAEELAHACADRIAAREDAVQAFAWFDPEFLMAQARACDSIRKTGRPLGPLHGLPVGLKDIIDTARIPTENGTELDVGRVPERDAFIVQRIKAAGAVIAGKTVTTELAFMSPGKTTNPHSAAHTPGGSSSGSAAAVASGMVPLAIGSQTAGSIIRPASFCGVVGYKPSFGAIPRTGVLAQSPSLDTLGVFARCVEDAALLAEVLFGYDSRDPATSLAPHPQLLKTASSPPPVPPTLAFVRTPFWEQAEPEMQAALQELVDLLGECCFEAALPSMFSQAAGVREQVNFAEMAKCFHSYEKRGKMQLSQVMCEAMEKGRAVSARDYIAAQDWPAVLNAGLGKIFERCDAILAPAAPGPAPEGRASTGNSVFNGIWTFCGAPAVTLPLFKASNGLPMGVQLIGRQGEDGRLLRTAAWLVSKIASSDEVNP